MVMCEPDPQATACKERPICRQKSPHLIGWPIKEYTQLWPDGRANAGPPLTQQWRVTTTGIANRCLSPIRKKLTL
jgi:hypothetical protein